MKKTEKQELTPRETETLKHIKAHIEKEHFPPTVEELRLKLKVKSTYIVRHFLKRLETKGHIKRKAHGARSIVVL